MFTLIGIGAWVAWLFSLFALLFPSLLPPEFLSDGVVHVYFESATVILTLVLLGQLLEARAYVQTNSAVKELLELTPDQVTKIVDWQEILVSIQDVKVWDILRIKPGSKIPVDGIITEWSWLLDESMLTWESEAIAKSSWDLVNAGTLNTTSSFLMQAQKVWDDTFLGSIIDLVKQASISRAPIQWLADKISSYFVPMVVMTALLTAIIRWIRGPYPAPVYALVNAVAVLIIACPCALGLATPMSIVVWIGQWAKSWILIKNAETIEVLPQIDTIIFDKTWTLTIGRPEIQTLVPLEWYNSDKLLQLSSSINYHSEHPLALSFITKAESDKIERLEMTAFEALPGRGVQAVYDGRLYQLWNDKLFDEDTLLDENLLAQASQARESGATISFLLEDKKLIGYISIADSLRSDAQHTIQVLQDQWLQVMILSWDHEQTVKSVATELWVNSYQAGLLPDEKHAIIVDLQSSGRKVAMVGDGINDSPSLAQAHVGITLQSGTDVALQAADVTLTHNRLDAILQAFNLGKSTMRNIRQNLFFALVYNTLWIPLAAGLLYPWFGILLSPMIAALAMSFSSVSVIANSLRLRTIKLR